METTNKPTVEQLEALMRQSITRSAESFERCDTDGALSQWGHDTMARKRSLEIELARAGWMHAFPAVIDVTGAGRKAKRIEGRFGLCWAVVGDDGKLTGEFFGLGKRALANHGFEATTVDLPAHVILVGNGLTNVMPIIVPDQEA